MKRVSYSLNKPAGIRFSRHQAFVFSLFLLLLGSFTRATAQTAVIPDPNFRQFLTQTYPTIMNASGELIIAEAAKIEFLDCERRRITDLTGIQHFTGLVTLRCYSNELTALPDISGLTQLRELTFSYNKFTTFPDVSKNVLLSTISASGNQLSSLPNLSPLTQLHDLRFGENQFTAFPASAIASNLNLGIIDCDNNQMRVIPDLSHFKNLYALDVSNNQLTTLPDLSQFARLGALICSQNQLTRLPDLSHNLELTSLSIDNNNFTEFPDISANTKLAQIFCSNNQLRSLPDLSNHLGLTQLWCQQNQLTALPDLSNNTKLEQLFCSYNQLTALPELSNNAKLEHILCNGNQLTALPDLSATALKMIECEDNQLSSLPNFPAAIPLITFRAERNKLTFEDILPMLPFRADAFVGTASQQPVGPKGTIRVKTGDSYTIDLDIDHAITDNVYKWYKRSGRTSTLVATTSENKLTLSSITPADTGSYTCIVTNPRVATQTLQLQSFSLKIQTDEPWLPVTSGGDNHLIVIPNNISTSINGMPVAVGDYIGIFFEENSNLVSGGMVKWTGDHLTLNAWASTSTPKNGFLANETFTIKVWRAAERKEYTVNAAFNTEAPYTHAGSFAANGFSSIKSLSTTPVCVQQVIALYAGWNLISLNVQPGDLAMSAIFAGKQDVLVKDAAGRVQYAPQNGITSGVWNVMEGYKVLVSSAQTLTVCGTRMNPLTPIAIPQNPYPYFLPYFASVAMPVTNGLNGLGTSLSFAQSNEYRDGSTVMNAYNYLPAHVIDPAINQIGMMRPGLAYKVSVTGAVPAFCYPSVNGMRVSGERQLADVAVFHYALPASATGNNALLVIPKDAFGRAIAEGDEIAIFTASGTLAGAGRYTNENMAITVWENEQMQTGESYHLKVWKQDSQEELAAQVVYQKGNGQYAANSVQMVKQARLATRIVDTPLQQTVTYPNPASTSIHFKPATHQTGAVIVSLYDLMGAKLMEVSKASLETVRLDVHHLPAGQYVCVVKANGQESRSKIVVVK